MFKEENRFITWAVVVTLLLMLVGYGVHWISKPARLVDKLTEPDHIIQSYEEYENMYEACITLCSKISALESSNVNDPEFSTSERLLALQNLLDTRIGQYNAKSRMITKNMWKSKVLPYQLSRDSLCQN